MVSRATPDSAWETTKVIPSSTLGLLAVVGTVKPLGTVLTAYVKGEDGNEPWSLDFEKA